VAITAAKITPCLWFDTEAEGAAQSYVSIFPNSRIGSVSRYGTEGHEIHGKEAGSVMTVEFEIGGLKFLALNGGPQFPFTEAISFQVHCETQEEIDYFWDRLSEDGSEGPCGWLKDKYGVSWQGGPDGPRQAARRPESGAVAAGDAGVPADEEVRHRGPAAGLRRGRSMSGVRGRTTVPGAGGPSGRPAA